jgi:hypothetical protein
VVTADLFARAGERRRGRSGATQTLYRALERAKAISANSERSLQLEVVAHRLAWYGDTEGALRTAWSAVGTVGQEKALVWVVQALAGRGDLAAAEPLAAELKSKKPRQYAESWLAHARAGEFLGREPLAQDTWDGLLAYAEQSDDPDDRLNMLVGFIDRHMLTADAGRELSAALLRVRRAMAEGGKAIKAARLRTDLVTTPVYASEVKWRGQKPGAARDVAAQKLARLCRIAGAQAMIGDLSAALETAGLIEDGDFRACALALVLSGWLEGQARLRYA